jgi:dTMP kinase
MLAEALKVSGKVCVILDFPDYTTPIGMEIKAFLEGKRDYLSEVKHLLFSANRWEKKKEIESMLENGTIIVMNRYWQSNLVYGAANGMDVNWLLRLDKGLPKEDFGQPPHICQARRDAGRVRVRYSIGGKCL